MSQICQPVVSSRNVIYQLLVRTFGNTNETQKNNGTLAENGCGKFNDINDIALSSLKQMGFNCLWLTGVLEQASGTAYPSRPADDPDILKGIAGSPYAIRDYFDVCPDYAMEPEKRLIEFVQLIERCHSNGLKVIIDFVPNHVARSYDSDVMPQLSFGKDDRRDVFFDRDNHFYYLSPDVNGNGPPLLLPTLGSLECDGLFNPETTFGRVTGNNLISWTPSVHDWYETVKLNYGHDFTMGSNTAGLPGSDASLDDVPKTWRTMDEILAYWQKLGIDGFRADMAHMIPLEFWTWALKRARARCENVFFVAEAYDNDPKKLTDKNVLDALLEAGFDAIYDDPSYDIIEGIYDSNKWANDLDSVAFSGSRFHRSLRYSENHDEVRIANPNQWGGLGMKVGRPVSAVLYSMGQGPVMLYHGQEVGEPAIGSEGFSRDDARTSIFDYGSMPEFIKWVNGGLYDGGRLSIEQKSLRNWYSKLLHTIQAPAFTAGKYYGLNHANLDNSKYGRVGDETVSGHWLYSFLRHDPTSKQTFLIIANFHGTEILHDVVVHIPEEAWKFIDRINSSPWLFSDVLDSQWSGMSENCNLQLPNITPCSALVLKISNVSHKEVISRENLPELGFSARS